MKWNSRWIVSWIRCEGFCNAVHCDDTFYQIKFWIYKVPESMWNHVATYYSVFCMLSFLLSVLESKNSGLIGYQRVDGIMLLSITVLIFFIIFKINVLQTRLLLQIILFIIINVQSSRYLGTQVTFSYT